MLTKLLKSDHWESEEIWDQPDMFNEQNKVSTEIGKHETNWTLWETTRQSGECQTTVQANR